jgi:hypothetical protein
MVNTVTVIFHKDCKASTDLILLASKLQGYEIEYIDIATDKFETEIIIDVVPFIIIDNSESGIFKGKLAFDKIEELITLPVKKVPVNTLKYGATNKFVEDVADKSQKIDLDVKRKTR